MATSVFHETVKKVWIFIISPRRNEHYRNYVIFKQALNDIKQSIQRLNTHSLSHVHLSHPRCRDWNATTHAFPITLRRAHSNAPVHNNIGEGFTNYVLYIFFLSRIWHDIFSGSKHTLFNTHFLKLRDLFDQMLQSVIYILADDIKSAKYWVIIY
jgi:hypothetical protein